MLRTLAILALLSAPAFAQDVPTVALTAAELQTLVNAEIAKAADARALLTSQAAPVYQKVQSAFAPKPLEAKPEDAPK